jgi:hypothetical protein
VRHEVGRAFTSDGIGSRDRDRDRKSGSGRHAHALRSRRTVTPTLTLHGKFTPSVFVVSMRCGARFPMPDFRCRFRFRTTAHKA